MKRASAATKWRRRRIAPAAALLAALALPLRAAPHADRALEQQLLATMQVLASDDFLGREPGTPGETKTLRWLGAQWFDIGLVSGTNDPAHPWFAPVTVIARRPAFSLARFGVREHVIGFDDQQALVLTSGRRSLVEGAPLDFVGRGSIPPRAELAGRVALLLDRAPPDQREPDDVQGSARQNALLAGGAAAVVTILDGPRSLASVAARRDRPGYALSGEALGGDLEAFVTAAGFARVLAEARSSLDALERDADRPDFTPHPLGITAHLEATTSETTIRTHNLIGKLPGRHPEAGAVLLLAHWDHFGTCAQPPAEHLICNGAIDNASGVAALTEIARRLAKGPPLDRDVYFLATTAEELGLLGAEAFAESPPLPLRSIVAAFNLDSVAIAPAGTAVGIVGKGMTGIEPDIVRVARAAGRRVSDSTAPNTYIGRQDGWVLLHHDVPTVMITSAYGDMARLQKFFDGDYHRPSDVVKPGIELGGAAEDVLLHVALVRWFADLKTRPGASPMVH
ncbi:MAG: M28 family peptidase [Sphingomonadales bacterium]|nr:M28 family peptidase [Sphingomonadales bacterium]